VEGGCLGCPRASTVISQPLDSKMLPIANNSHNTAMNPCSGTSDTLDTVITVEKKGGYCRGREAENKEMH